MSWRPVVGSEIYRVYREKDGAFRFLSETRLTKFTDDGSYTLNDAVILPVIRDLSIDGNAIACTYHGQRLVLAGTDKEPYRWAASGIGDATNFYTSGDVTADAPINATLVSDSTGDIRHVVSVNDLIIFMSDSNWRVAAEGGAFTPSTIRQRHKPVSYTHLTLPTNREV